MMIHEIRNHKTKERVWLKYPRSMIPFDTLYFYLDENLRGGILATILTHLLIAGGSCGRSNPSWS